MGEMKKYRDFWRKQAEKNTVRLEQEDKIKRICLFFCY